MIVIDPITREEILLAKALGENVPDIVPIIRKEMYLAKIAGADISTPEAITREEMYLDAIANGTDLSLEPITRKEMFYAKALGLVENAPEPITRIENLLNQITAGGGGGFDKYSWEGVFASVKAGTYATDYAIGDMIPLDLGSEGIINMQIAAFDTDDLADGSGKAPITWIAKELLKTVHKMNATNDSTGGWEQCLMRTYLKETIKPMIPINVRNNIAVVKKTQRYNKTTQVWNSEAQTTEDDVWIPGADELYKVYTSLFPNQASRVKCVYYESVGGNYFTRDSNSVNFFTSITISGDYDTNTIPNAERGVCLCFCT